MAGYGLGYGLGAAGAGMAQGALNATMIAPKLQAENLQNQETQMNVQQRQAQNAAYGTQAPAVQDSLTPYDQQLADLKAQHDAVPAGQGIVKQQIQEKAINLGKERMNYLLGAGVQHALAQDSDSAVKYFNAAGTPAESIKLDPETGKYMLKLKGDDEPKALDPKQLYAMSNNPEMMSQFASHLMQNDYMMNMLGFKGQQLQETTRQHDLAHEDKQGAIAARLKAVAQSGINTQVAGQYRVQASVGAASTNQQGANYRFNKNPTQQSMDFMTDKLGLDPTEAQSWLNEVQQNRKAGKSDDETALNLAMKAHAGLPLDPDQLKKDAATIKSILPQQTPVAPPKPRNRTVPPPTPQTPPASTGEGAVKVFYDKAGTAVPHVLKNGQWVKK